MDATEGIRLAPLQRRLWLLGEVHGPASARGVFLLEGALDAGALRGALGDVAARHDVLRTCFVPVPGLRVPVQVIADGAAPVWSEEDLPAAPRTAEELAAGPVLRAALLALGGVDRHELVLDLPALCADARTFEILKAELAAAYEARVQGGGVDGEPLQYWQYAEWLSEMQEEAEAAAGRAYWERAVEDGLAALPGEVERPEEGFPSGLLPVELNPELEAAVRRAADGQGAEPADFLLAAWRVLLWRLTGEERPAVGVALDGRELAELEDTLGPFTRVLPLAGRVEGGESFAGLLAELRRGLAEMAGWQRFFAWEPSAAALRDRRAFHGVTPFVFESRREGPPAVGGGVAFSLAEVRTEGEPFVVKLLCRERGEALTLHLAHDAGRLGAAGAARFASCLRVLLASAAERPESPVRELELLSGAERAPAIAGEEACVHHLFTARAVRAPDAPAVIFGERQLSYGELDARANGLAHRLRALGVGPESRAGVCFEPGPEAVVALLGIWKAGGAYVAVDPQGPAERRDFMLRDAGAAVLLTQPALAGHFPEFAGEVVAVDLDGDPGAAGEPVGGAVPADLAYVLYTSGSTGTPKGVGIEHRHLARYLGFVDRELFGDRVHWCPLLTALTFDACLKQIFAPLLRGDAVWGLGADAALNPAALLAELGGRPAVGLNCTPTLWRAILGEAELEGAVESLSGLASLFLGGERLSQDLFARTAARLPHTRIWNLYGPTEATANAAAAVLAPEDPVTLGRPLPYTRIHLLDGLVPMPPGVPGEIAIGGGGVARGYLGRPDLTAERFMPDPFAAEPGARLYRSGDLGRLTPEGDLEFLGRIDHQVKVRGFRIELSEIETRLEGLPAVREAAVLAEEEGEEARLVAYLVPAPDASGLTPGELRAALGETLPEYMVPANFVVLTRLPRLSSGKVDRTALSRSGSALASGRSYVAPRTPTEQRIAEIWADVLGREQVGADDDFFELGGHSIQSIQITHRINEAGYPVTPRDLLHHPSVAALAAVADAASRPAAPAEGEEGDFEEGRI